MSDFEVRVGELLQQEANKASLPLELQQRVLQQAKGRRVMLSVAGGVVALAIGILAIPTLATLRPASNVDPASAPSSREPSSRMIDGCPVTIPPKPGYDPPEPYPNNPPELYGAVWYGSAELWTKLAPEGAVWEDLPDEDADGELTEKTLLVV